MQEFVTVREIVERERKAELKKQAAAAAADAKDAKDAGRRHSATVTSAQKGAPHADDSAVNSAASTPRSTPKEEVESSNSKAAALQEMIAKRGLARRGSVH